MPDPSHPDDPKPIGDVSSLFDTDEIRPIRVPPASSPSGASAPASEGYDLEGYSVPDEDEEPPQPVPLPTPVERPKAARPKPQSQPQSQPRAKADDLVVPQEDSSEFEAEVSIVDPVWTRGAEWGADLFRIGAIGLGTLALVWMIGSNYLTLCFLVLVLGGAAMVLLSYPILVTLERPVRITPEQAVTDFFAAASHHFPHYRRMWLLLSSSGRDSGPFANFADFRDYWKRRIDRWRGARGAGKYAPLKFDVLNFRADKSAGKTTSRADYTVEVSLRDREGDGPIETFRMMHGLVKGPDRMWYLNRGTLDPPPR